MKDKSLRVLMVEDSEKDELLIIRNLKKGGYNPVYERVETASAMKKALKEKQWDIILCEYSLPQFNAASATAVLKKANIDIPLIVVTGTIGKETISEFMSLEVQGYIMKSNLSHLCPAIERELEDAKVRNRDKQVEETLRKSEERFRRISSMTSDIAYSCRTNEDGIFSIDWMIGATEQITGYSIEEIKAQRCWRFLVAEEDLALFEKNVVGLAPGSQGLCELRIRHKNGGIVWIASHTECFMVTETPEHLMLYGALVDITERKKAEEKMEASEERFRLLADNSTDVIWTMTLEGKFTYISPSIIKLSGYTPQEAMEIPFHKYVVESYVEPTMAEIASQLQKPPSERLQSFQIELQQYCKDGTIKDIEVTTGWLFDDRNEPIGIQGSTRDITERKQAQKMFEDIIDKNPMSIQIVDKEGFTLLVNPAHTLLFGAVPPANFSIFTDLQHKNQELEKLILLAKSGEVVHLPDILYNVHDVDPEAPDNPVWIRAIIFPLKDSYGKSETFVLMHENITDRKRAEEVLQESEEMFRSYLERAPDGVYTSDLKGTFLYGNSKCEEIIGYKREELIGKNFLELNILSEKSLNKAAQLLQDNLEDKPTGPDEIELISKEGRLIPVEINTSVVQRMGQAIVLGFVRDITERKRAEEEVSRLASVIYHSREIVSMSTPDGKMIFLNDAGKKMFGIAEENIAQTSVMDVIPEHLQDKVRHEVLPMIVSNGYWKGDLQYLNIKTGRLTDVHARTYKITDQETGKLQYLANISTDITDRKKIENLWRESEARLREVLENSREVSYKLNLQTNHYDYLSPVFTKLSGYAIDEIKSLSFEAIMDLIHPDDHAEMGRVIAESISGAIGTAYQMNYRFKHKDSQYRWYQDQFTIMRDADGHPLAAIGSVSDITKRKRAEEELQQTLESLRKALGATIQVLIAAVEMRDPYTAGHQLRVANLARDIATEMGLSQDKIEGIRMAGSIHDIGRLSIPAEILTKPSKLTNTEFALIKDHSLNGYEMLKNVESPWPLAQIVYQHHERMNGSGYPRNLRGDEILMEARIMAVADVVEAMASHRPYRPSLGIDAALAEIEKNKGTFFDDAVADACLRLFREKGYQLT